MPTLKINLINLHFGVDKSIFRVYLKGMKLKTYFEKNGIESITQWCNENELSFSTVYRHIQTNKPVRRENAHKIHKITDGQVSLLELLDPPEVK